MTPALDSVLLASAGPIATITLNRPEKRNPLSAEMIGDLGSALDWCRRNAAVRVVVLSGSGSAFCAGADLASSFAASGNEVEKHQERGGLVELFSAMRRLGKPIIARVNGPALAGGFGLVCACDLIVAVESAQFGTPEINVGVWPMVISAILARNLPRKVVLEMLLLGERWTARQLESAGLVSRVASDPAELDRMTEQMAAALAAKSPAVLRLGRDAFYATEDMSFLEAAEYLQAQLTLVSLTDDSREGIRAFLEKRSPEFKGR